MTEIKFLAPAEAEFLDAISYYNMQSEGLGYEFAAEVKEKQLNELFSILKHGLSFQNVPVVVEPTGFPTE